MVRVKVGVWRRIPRLGLFSGFWVMVKNRVGVWGDMRWDGPFVIFRLCQVGCGWGWERGRTGEGIPSLVVGHGDRLASALGGYLG